MSAQLIRNSDSASAVNPGSCEESAHGKTMVLSPFTWGQISGSSSKLSHADNQGSVEQGPTLQILSLFQIANQFSQSGVEDLAQDNMIEFLIRVVDVQMVIPTRKVDRN